MLISGYYIFELKAFKKLKNNPIIFNTWSSVLTVLAIGCFAFFYFNSQQLPNFQEAQPVVISSTSSGNWNSSSGWDLKRRPENGDKVIIQSDHVKTIDKYTNLNGEIIVNGKLVVWKSFLSMNSHSKVTINEDGKILFSSPVEILGYPYTTAQITIGSEWFGGTVIESSQKGPVAFGNAANESFPVDLITLNAELTPEHQAKITWFMNAKQSTGCFTIERSLDGRNFFILDTIKVTSPNNELAEYAYIDEAPVSGFNYYRLVQRGMNGISETFSVLPLFNKNAEPELSIVSIGPNPYVDKFEINFTSSDNSKVHMKIADMQGRTLFTKSLEAEKGLNSFTYVDRKNLQPGVYLFTIVQRGTPAKTYRLVKDS